MNEEQVNAGHKTLESISLVRGQAQHSDQLYTSMSTLSMKHEHGPDYNVNTTDIERIYTIDVLNKPLLTPRQKI